ncbi:GNAT family N-acetyltransferase [Vibrio breoganii]|uniref:GNAT family N-acetyltransferase n=1 Tax=Vibrio breoganii TaxID=553239 RepID=A0ABX1UE81_9VIBR|nr:GNAT family N-acetyltransferase [Vibrio breoganii]NMO75247.1 GNAT family N-acetyltransferase [Vibrio breoganii]NMR71763.1 GNAT family N-acetyltransferase [Vibrio breoganii]PMG03961.1 GNAT family N-acetyltransferase [Vibrio breoganii]PMH17285.1 GNAT family N-acetyltransferase [Vibrio breoganii]PML82832.1 GNAT family N-acetyltransferase [Vibrio breoganii]
MRITEYHPSFSSELSEVYLESRTTTFTWLNSSDFKLSDFEKDTEGETILLAVLDEKAIGFISIWEPENFVHHLYVSSEHLGKGVGSLLLTKAQSMYGKLSLKCLVENQKAVRFYELRGFSKKAKHRDSVGEYYLMQMNSLD